MTNSDDAGPGGQDQRPRNVIIRPRPALDTEYVILATMASEPSGPEPTPAPATEQRFFNYAQRKALFGELSALRKGRVPIFLCNFDRTSQPPGITGLQTLFAADTKEVLYRLLKEADTKKGIDLVLYTRGGDANAVWPLVSLIREFDPEFEVVVPFRCHSSGTALALGARRIVMTRLSELSPIDATTANQFNPREETNPLAPKAISVEDVRSFFDLRKEHSPESKTDYLELLSKNVHPLALGNVQRVYLLVKSIASALLSSNGAKKRSTTEIDKIVKKLASEFYSHVHAISRHEAREILGEEEVMFSDAALETCLDKILRAYQLTFKLREQYILKQELGNNPAIDVGYIGGILESEARSYIFKTKGTWFQMPKIPAGVQINVPAGSMLPIMPGLPVDFRFEIKFQDWVHNAGGE